MTEYIKRNLEDFLRAGRAGQAECDIELAVENGDSIRAYELLRDSATRFPEHSFTSVAIQVTSSLLSRGDIQRAVNTSAYCTDHSTCEKLYGSYMEVLERTKNYDSMVRFAQLLKEIGFDHIQLPKHDYQSKEE